MSDVQTVWGAEAPAMRLFVASLLANFFDAGWAVQVLVGDSTRAQFESSRIARPTVHLQLRTMSASAAALPVDVREQMPLVDWQSWEELGPALARVDAAARSLAWNVIEHWLPPTGLQLRRYRRQLPGLWRFDL